MMDKAQQITETHDYELRKSPKKIILITDFCFQIKDLSMISPIVMKLETRRVYLISQYTVI